MPPAFTIHTTSRFRRDVRKLVKQNTALVDTLEVMQTILTTDPYNRSRQHDIKKLVDVKSGEGQWRIRQGDYRLRYDICDLDVVLYSFRHRREIY